MACLFQASRSPRDCRPGGDLLLLGGDDRLARDLARAGFRVQRHALDTGPLAQLAGVPFTPPVVQASPSRSAAYDAVVLLDELALVVKEEEALAEAARVLRPGGVLVLRVPAEGRLAWLDGFNVYRYVQNDAPREASPGGGGRRLAATLPPPRCDRPPAAALRRHHAATHRRRLEDTVRLAGNLWWRWLRRDDTHDATVERAARRAARLESGWRVAGWGYGLMVAARRRAR